MSRSFKQGATSIYAVIISMLLLTVITVSFIKIAVTEAQRTAADELSQSSYDSALAGVEDAKLALKQYYNCKNAKTVQNTAGDDLCPQIITAIEKGFASPTDYCDGISQALGRAAEGVEVPIQESEEAKNNFEQAYTCVMLNNRLDDFRSQLDASTPMRAIALKTNNADSVTGIKIAWHNIDDDGPFNFTNQTYFAKNQPTVAAPTVLSAHIVQTSKDFTLEQFDDSEGDRTNNATVVLKPVENGSNYVTAQTLIKSNKHEQTNVPQAITCNKSGEFACVVSLVLPKPRGDGVRRGDTFYLFLSLPYEQPTTTFSVQLCTDTDSRPGACQLSDGSRSIAPFIDSQIAVDSTGRANSMYTRVEARLEFNDLYAPLPEHALYSLSQSGGIDKDFYVTKNCWSQKNDFSAQTCADYGVKN